MKIVQLLPTIAYGDAVSNDAIALKYAIRQMGYWTNIYAENIDPRLSRGVATSIKKMPCLSKRDIIIYHLSTGTMLNYSLGELIGKKIIIYHNITPPSFFHNYSMEAERKSKEGLAGARYISSIADYVLAVSEFNKRDLIKMGYTCQVNVLPILISFDEYLKEPDKDIIKKYNDGRINIIFTGRIAPNKKQEDIISVFYYYKKYINASARLFLVGSGEGMETYENQLKEYVKRLHLEDVYFTGKVRFNEVLAYYKIADLFLCMSEHEGFCVPLVEAMFFDIPIVAYDSCAVGDTLGGSGFLLESKNYQEVAEVINRVLSDQKLKEDILINQRIRLQDFNREKIVEQFRKYLREFINEQYKG